MLGLVFLISSCVSVVLSIPQVFTESYTFCEIPISEKKKIEFPDKLWTVDAKDIILHFSFCKSKQVSCKNQTSSCLVRKITNEIFSFGDQFAIDELDSNRLITQNGAKCPNSNTNYTLIVTLQCSDSIKPKPFLSNSEDGCTFEITMKHPTCTPKCTQTLRNAYLLDLRAFRQSIQVDSNPEKFSLSVCGPNRNCNQGATSCEITNNSRVPLADIQSQRINYNAGKNELTVRGRYRQGGQTRKLEILIRCDWEANAGEPVYIRPPHRSPNYKFEIKSSYGCIILPHQCRIHSIDNLNYDLSALNRPAGWKVADVPRGSITVNICGPLQVPKSVCSDQHSQVCHLNDEKYTNRGSVLASLSREENDVINAIFVSGSRCDENPHLLHSTIILFSCYKLETGPRFMEYNNCVTKLVWETPSACPLDYYTGENCYINDRLANRNLQKLYSETDRTYRLTDQSEITYNLCGPVHFLCGGFSNTSFCLTKQGKEVVVGWDKRELISDNGRLRLESDGPTCGKIVVEFVCSYEEPPRAPFIHVVEDGCKFNLTIFTSLACLTTTPFNACLLNTTNNTWYDLSALSKKIENFVIPSEQNLEYIMNVCGPVVSNEHALCRGDTMICLRNKTEVNRKYQYRSLGGVGRPTLVDNSLILETTTGTFCPGLGYYKSIIHFECSNQDSAPVLSSNDECVYHFSWKTKEACPHFEECVVNGSKPYLNFDLSQLQKKTMNINVDNNTVRYEFHMCQDSYVKYVNNSRSTFLAKREYFTYDNKPFLCFHLNSSCDESGTVAIINFQMVCSLYSLKEYFEETSFHNCVLNITIWTHIVCHETKEKPVSPPIIEKVTSPTTTKPKEPLLIRKNCSVTNPYTGYRFDLEQLHPEQIGPKNYLINFDGSSITCNALICKKGATIVLFNTCPVVSFNYAHELVQLQFTSFSKCSSENFHSVEVWLKCNHTTIREQEIQNDLCKTVIMYESREACLLLKRDSVVEKAATATIISATAGGILLIVIVFVGLYLFQKHRGRLGYLDVCHDKSCVPIYTRDTVL